jgi:ATP-binding cassette subfamily F protein 3
MIVIKDLSIAFGSEYLFEEGSFTINYGDRIGLIGRNGTGKSTLLKAIMGRIPIESGKIDISEYYTIGYLEQHINFTKDTVLEEVCTVLSEDRIHEEYKAEKILHGLGFTNEDMIKSPHEFSGGYQIKMNLAKVLLMEPNMLLLDEPTNYLDIAAIRWLVQFLKKWDGEILLITHDRSVMDEVTKQKLIIHRKRFRKFTGSVSDLVQQIKTEEENYEKTRINEEKKRKETEEWIQRFGSKASMASRVQSRVKQLDKQEEMVKLDEIRNLSFSFTHTPYQGNEYLINVKNLSFGYTPEKQLIKNLSFYVDTSDKICIIGRNGNGKSTLLSLLGGELEATAGEIKMHDKVKLGYFGQTNISRLNPDNTIVGELEERHPSVQYNHVRRICASMLFPGDSAQKKIGVLSGGEKARVMLGNILLSPTNMLFLDEPTNHFDMESSESLMEAIKEFPGAVMMVTHNEYFLKEIATKLIVFDRGETFWFDGNYQSFLKEVGWAE